jgi:steroid delta-isomerase-like uncharacterized protein
MSIKANKVLACQFFYELLKSPNLESISAMIDVSYVDHAAPPGLAAGPDGFRQLVRMFRQAFPDMMATVEDVIAEGDRVVLRWTARGTHQGDLMGFAPTGREVRMTGINIYRIASGRIVERWGNSDDFGMWQQLGTLS